MIGRFRRYLAARRSSQAGRALSVIGHEQQRARIREKAAAMRASLGLAPHPSLSPQREHKHV